MIVSLLFANVELLVDKKLKRERKRPYAQDPFVPSKTPETKTMVKRLGSTVKNWVWLECMMGGYRHELTIA